MPIAVALGVEPALPYVGGMPLPEGADESHYLGAYFGEPLDVVPAETVDLLVPATAEIVIEGHVSHTDVADEGPMGEYPGYLDPQLRAAASRAARDRGDLPRPGDPARGRSRRPSRRTTPAGECHTPQK